MIFRRSTKRKIFTSALIFISLLGFFLIAFQSVVYGQSPGSLRVYSGLTGAIVYVDGASSGSTDSYSGATVTGLVVGYHTLKLSMPGYKDWTKQVNITSSQTTTVYAYLEPGSGVSVTRSETISYDSALGILKVNTGITGVSVYLGDEYGGKTDSYSGAPVNGLIAGTYTLKLSLTGYKDWTKQVTITVAKTTTIYAYLEVGTGVSTTRGETIVYNAAYGSLKVNTGINNANVYVGDEFGGSTDSYSGATVNGLIAGTYTLKLNLTGYKDWTKQVTITVAKTTTIYAYLESGSGVSVTRSETISYDSALGTLKVNTGITGVNVYVGNEYGGKTDSYSGATVNGLIAGTYTLKLNLTGYKDWTKQVSITVGKTTTIYAYPENGTGTSVTRDETVAFDSPYGILSVNAGLDSVGVYVGGEYGGQTDYWGATVNGIINGIYMLKLTLPGYNEFTQQVTITTGQTTTVQANLIQVSTSSTHTDSPNPNSPSSGPTKTPYIPPTTTPVIKVTESPSSTNAQSTFQESQSSFMWILYLVIAVVSLSLLAVTAYLIINRRRSITIDVKGKGTTNPSLSVQKYKKGTQAIIEAIPDSGWEFEQWSGDINGKGNPITLTVNNNCTIIATFVQAEGNRQVFISHVEEDAEIASAIAKRLENNNYRAWYYERDSVPGPSYIVKIGEAIKQSQAFILVISPHSLFSNQVQAEVIAAHEA